LERMGVKAVPALHKAVSTGGDQVVERAATALSRMGRGAKAALPALLKTLGSRNHSDLTRLALAAAVMKIDAAEGRVASSILAAIPVYIRLLRNGRPEQQDAAIEILSGIGPAASDALPPLRDHVKLTSDLGRKHLAKTAIIAIENMEN